MAGKYAEGTQTSVATSLGQLERVIERYGCEEFTYAVSPTRGRVAFRILTAEGAQRIVRIDLPMPDRKDTAFTQTPSGKWARTETQARAAYDQEVRRRWRALVEYVKMTLEAVASGIVAVDEAFMPFLLLSSGQTVYEAVHASLLPSLDGAPRKALTLRVAGDSDEGGEVIEAEFGDGTGG